MKVNITIPETLNEITLNQFQKYMKLIKDNEPSEFVNQKTIEIFCNIKLLDVAKISYKSYKEILDHLNSLFNVNHKLVPTFVLDGLEFGFEPNLEDIASGVYIDAESYLKETDTLHKAMAVLYRPIKDKRKNLYNIEEYVSSELYSDLMKDAPLDVALGMQVFFWNLGIELSSVMIAYLQQEKIQLSEAEKKVLEKNGVGTPQFMQQLEEVRLSLMKLQNSQLINF
jgi:hypothetical protein